MKIALIGYGKMGKAIEAVALEQGHEVVAKFDVDHPLETHVADLQKADVAIEFTGPTAAPQNLLLCFQANVPVVCGSTGWLEQWSQVETAAKAAHAGLIYASNFSIGVNLFFELNKQLAQRMQSHPAYEVYIREIHHTAKKDAPSGTAISLAEQVLGKLDRKKNWQLGPSTDPACLSIYAERVDPAPGTHHVVYTSAIDDIAIVHTAHNRTGFAAGAVLAAQFLVGKQGIFTMQDVLGLG